MIVAGHIIPLPIFVPDHHHTILARVKIVIWLIRSPVLILLKGKVLLKLKNQVTLSRGCFFSFFSEHLPLECHLSTGSHSQKSYHLVQSTGNPVHWLKKRDGTFVIVKVRSHIDILCCLLTSLTVNEYLLLRIGDADQVSSKAPTVLFSLLPHCSVRKMQVTVALKLSPAFLTCFNVCSDI